MISFLIFDVASELFCKDDSTGRNRIDISMSRISVIVGYIIKKIYFKYIEYCMDKSSVKKIMADTKSFC